ncbi:DUF1963 domain-containing protein [Aureibaculum sp. 2210JD6-5]|uniref:DUF1963 domain-containing protein n=1 Tax=Aureibaculum sp. 2210JD6-5 TaxID=3103957 RepID=UPI002AACDFEB|nr:DUF1963 domain-containing protein [Aureibaculum sp. 2210JD6-5]MDY7395723.1 DUF1963 domain-containing protein [Aureibaculum sp. 2210JD6-5]
MLNFKKNKFFKIKSFINRMEDGGIRKIDKEQLIKMIRPTIGIKTKSSEDKRIEIGKSKIGGQPDLPENFDWPRVNEKPMLFCAQYNLSELNNFDKENILPKKGLFYIFLSLDDKWKEFNGVNQAFKFIFSDSENLIRTTFPSDQEESARFKSALIEYFEFYTVPHYENYKLFKLHEKYEDLNDALDSIILYIDKVCESKEDRYHQILGEDRSMQSSAVYDFAAKNLDIFGADSSKYQRKWSEILELSKNYQILLQLDCYDPNSDLSKFGGSGKYYFGITENDIKKQNFNNVKMTFQL